MVLGAGPAGLSAAVYAARSGAVTAVAEAYAPGGLVTGTPRIENYLGYEDIAGYDLAEKMRAHAERAGATFLYGKAEKIEDGERKTVTLSGGDRLFARALVLAMGNEPRKLGLANEDELLGAGLSYCATCDGNFFRGKTTVVAGGGSHATAAAQYLVPLCKKVYVVHEKRLPDIEGTEKIENARILSLDGKPLRAITLDCGGQTRTLETDGLFVSLGYTPSVRLVRDLVQTDESGYVVCDEYMRTSREGIFAAGDVRKKPLRQIVTAAADGAIAGQFAAVYARKKK